MYITHEEISTYMPGETSMRLPDSPYAVTALRYSVQRKRAEPYALSLQEYNIHLIATSMEHEFFYLISPYSNTTDAIKQDRATQAERFTHYLHTQQIPIYSPIAFYHHLVQTHWHASYSDSYESMLTQDAPFLQRAAGHILLALPGWEHSRGVAYELHYAHTLYIVKELP